MLAPQAGEAMPEITRPHNVSRPCATDPRAWVDAVDGPLATAGCERCEVATDCLLEALRLDAAHRRGVDPWGVSGVCGGVEFRPGQMPRRARGLAS